MNTHIKANISHKDNAAFFIRNHYKAPKATNHLMHAKAVPATKLFSEKAWPAHIARKCQNVKPAVNRQPGFRRRTRRAFPKVKMRRTITSQAIVRIEMRSTR